MIYHGVSKSRTPKSTWLHEPTVPPSNSSLAIHFDESAMNKTIPSKPSPSRARSSSSRNRKPRKSVSNGSCLRDGIKTYKNFRGRHVWEINPGSQCEYRRSQTKKLKMSKSALGKGCETVSPFVPQSQDPRVQNSQVGFSKSRPIQSSWMIMTEY